mmetsp:Transcript_62980/g.141924  ORF Transcript_62980/g.141924 Transcript_62980/m.141924 type:complete len:252 (-) Transcript_62980:55-810(-)
MARVRRPMPMDSPPQPTSPQRAAVPPCVVAAPCVQDVCGRHRCHAATAAGAAVPRYHHRPGTGRGPRHRRAPQGLRRGHFRHGQGHGYHNHLRCCDSAASPRSRAPGTPWPAAPLPAAAATASPQSPWPPRAGPPASYRPPATQELPPGPKATPAATSEALRRRYCRWTPPRERAPPLLPPARCLGPASACQSPRRSPSAPRTPSLCLPCRPCPCPCGPLAVFPAGPRHQPPRRKPAARASARGASVATRR